MADAKETQIRELPLFRDCKAGDVRWIAGVADTVDVPAGSTISQAGAPVREFVVVVRGTMANSDEAVVLAPGSCMGHTGLIDGRRHAHTIRTQTATRLLVFTRGAFKGLLDRVPGVGRSLLAEMVTQLPTADQPARNLRAVS